MNYKEFIKKAGLEGNQGSADLDAVKQNGRALEYVKDQTPEICLAAVKQGSGALAYVDKSIFDKG